KKWTIRNANTMPTQLLGVCEDILINFAGIIEEQNVFVTERCGYDIILGRTWESSVCAAYRNLDDGTCWVKVHSKDGKRAVQLMASPADHPHNREKVRESDF